MKFVTRMILVAAAVFALPLAAKDKVEPAVNASTKEAFQTVSTWVRGQMTDDGRYPRLSARERGTVEARLDEMGRLFEARGSVEQMSGDEKLKMLNAQEEVNGILAKRDNERLICTREAPIGSNLPVKTCRTAGEIEARRRMDNDSLRRRSVTTQNRSGG